MNRMSMGIVSIHVNLFETNKVNGESNCKHVSFNEQLHIDFLGIIETNICKLYSKCYIVYAQTIKVKT
jgi:hypothetical protein